MAVPVHPEKATLQLISFTPPSGFLQSLLAEHPGELLAVDARGDETIYQVHLFSGELATAVSHEDEYTKKENRCPELCEGSPQRRLSRVLVPQKGLKLVGGKTCGRPPVGPEAEPPL